MESWVFEDVNGQLRLIQSCPPLALFELKGYLGLLQAALEKADPEKDFRTLYLESSYIRQLCDRCLLICQIQPEWLSPNMLVEFLHHQISDDGDYAPGLLVEIMFSPSKAKSKGSGQKVEFEEWVADTIASLVSLELASDLRSAIEQARTIPSDLIEAISLSRIHHLDPKLKKQQEFERFAQEMTKKPEVVKELFTAGDGQWQDFDLRTLL